MRPERVFSHLAWRAMANFMQQPLTLALCSISTYAGLKGLGEMCPASGNIKREKPILPVANQPHSWRSEPYFCFTFSGFSLPLLILVLALSDRLNSHSLQLAPFLTLGTHTPQIFHLLLLFLLSAAHRASSLLLHWIFFYLQISFCGLLHTLYCSQGLHSSLSEKNVGMWNICYCVSP